MWGDRIFLLSAVPIGVSKEESHEYRGALPERDVHRYVVVAIDRHDGNIVWERVAGEQTPHEATHATAGTYASSSAITDGEHVVAFFESNGLYVYDMLGNLVWNTDLGDKRVLTEGGEGTPGLLAPRVGVERRDDVHLGASWARAGAAVQVHVDLSLIHI